MVGRREWRRVIISMVRCKRCHGMAASRPKASVKRIKEGRQDGLKQARARLAHPCRVWWGFQIKCSLDSFLSCSCPPPVWFNGRMNSKFEFGQNKNWEVCH